MQFEVSKNLQVQITLEIMLLLSHNVHMNDAHSQ